MRAAAPTGRLGTPFLAVAVLALIYAVCYSAIKAGLEFATPLRFAAWRALVGGIALFVTLGLLRRPFVPPRRLWPWIGGLALSGILVAYAAMFASPGRTGAGLASVLGNTGPLILVVLAWLVLRERVTAASAAALVLGALGVSLIASPAVAAPGRSGVIAYTLPLLAACGTASESVIYKRAQVGAALLSVAAWQLVAGSVFLFAAAGLLEGAVAVRWTPTFVGLLLFLGVVGTAVALTVWYSLVERHEVGRLGLLLFLVPVMGLGFAMAAFREPITPLQVVGVTVTVAGLATLARQERRSDRQGATVAGQRNADRHPR